jgi:hypothetical protein
VLLNIILIAILVGLVVAIAYLFRRSLAHMHAARQFEAFAPSTAAPSAFDPSTDEPLLLTEEWREKPETLPWALAAVAAIAPASAFLLRGGIAEGVMWIALIMALTGIFLASEHWRWAPGSWLAAGGATLWSLLTLRFAPPAPTNEWVPVFLAVLACAGLAHMRKARAGGLALAAGMGVATAVYSATLGADTPSGLALVFIVAASAVAGAMWRKHEGALIAAWLLGCGGLYVLSGQEGAEAWLTPASVLMAALFLAIQVIALPMRGREGLIPAATGAIAAPFAIGVLSQSQVGPSGAVFDAGAWLLIAAFQVGVIVYAGRRAGGLAQLGLAIVPPGLALIACLIAAMSVFGPVWAAALLSASTIAFALAAAREPHPLWNISACTCALAGLVHAASGTNLLLGARDAEALGLIFGAFVAPAAFLGFAGRLFAPRAPWTHATLEAGALIAGFAALIACVRFIGGHGAPGDLFIGAAETGVHLALWIGCAALLFLYERGGAFFVRRGAAAALIGLAAAALAFGAGGALNPWWGRLPTPAIGLPILNLLALGYALPAIAFGALSWLAFMRKWRIVRAGAVALAVFAAGLWLALEIRRGFHGADLSAGGAFPAETLVFSLLLLTASGALYVLRPQARDFEPGLATLLAGAIVAKAIFVDLNLPADGWRIASIVIMALACAALAAPREGEWMRPTYATRLLRRAPRVSANALT